MKTLQRILLSAEEGYILSFRREYHLLLDIVYLGSFFFTFQLEL